MDDHRKVVPQGPGWTCFFCEETFLSQKEAEEHFGLWMEHDDEDRNPGCVERMNFSEKALRAGLIDLFKDWLELHDELHAAMARIEDLEYQLSQPRLTT